ncbi:MAG: LrgB family protein [Bacilli bacterium]|nr:LrgB family protein [Bacilli bacterium]
MINLLTSPLFYLFLTIGIYTLFAWLSKKLHTPIFNPLLWTIILLSGYILLIVFIDKGNAMSLEDINYAVTQFQSSTSILDILLGPVTVALALPLYLNRHVLKENWLAILIGSIVGVGSSVGSVVLLGWLLNLDGSITLALYPRGVTTAIAREITTILGVGEHTSITVAMVVLTGVVGALLAPPLIKLFHDDEDTTIGLALGSASHAIGTSVAFNYSSKAGAIASVSMVTNGLLTVLVAIIVRLIIA